MKLKYHFFVMLEMLFIDAGICEKKEETKLSTSLISKIG